MADTDVATLIFSVDTTDVERLNEELKLFQKTGGAVEKSSKGITSSFKAQKNATQQASFQIQDFFVQVASGQGAMRAFSQQAPQFLSIFGPGGAILGAVIAIGAAIGSIAPEFFKVKTALDKLKESMDQLNKVVDKTDKGLIGLNSTLRQLAATNALAASAAITEAILDAGDAMKIARKEIVKLSKENGTLGASFAGIIADFEAGKIGATELGDAYDNLFVALSGVSEPGKDIRKFRSEIASLVVTFTDAENKSKSLANILADLGGKGTIDPKEQEQRESAINRLIESLKLQAQAAGEAGKVTAFMKAEQLGATEAELERISVLQQLIDTQKVAIVDEKERVALFKELQGDIEGIRKLAQEETAAIQEEHKRRNIQLRLALQEGVIIREEFDTLTAVSNEEANRRIIQSDTRLAQQRQILDNATLQAKISLFSSLGSILQASNDENSALGKAGYAISQGIAVAQAINNANLAASGVVASAASILDPTGTALAAGFARAEVVRGLGFANAALIAGNAVGTLAARSHGGQVRPGQSYRVGEFGPETLTLGSNGGTITPNGAEASNDKVNLNVLTNVQVLGGSSDTQVTTTTRQISDRKFVQDIVVDLMGNQSSPARQALQETSNIAARGNR